MFFGYREYEDGYIDGFVRRPFLPSTPGSRRRDAASTALSGNLSTLVRLHRAQGPGHGRGHVPLAQGPRQGPGRRVVGRADGGVE